MVLLQSSVIPSDQQEMLRKQKSSDSQGCSQCPLPWGHPKVTGPMPLTDGQNKKYLYSETVISWTWKKISGHLFQIFNSQYCDFKALKYL